MNRFTVQGVIVSKVDCNNERRISAQRLGVPVENVPLKYGSLRMGVNLIEVEGYTYIISKAPREEGVKEERLILEISYRYDYKNNSLRVTPEHSLVNTLQKGDSVSLVMSHAFLSKDHCVKLVGAGTSRAIKSYFMKAWADDIVSVDGPTLAGGRNRITPYEVLKSLNTDKNLIIA